MLDQLLSSWVQEPSWDMYIFYDLGLDLLKKLLEKDPKARITASEAL